MRCSNGFDGVTVVAGPVDSGREESGLDDVELMTETCSCCKAGRCSVIADTGDAPPASCLTPLDRFVFKLDCRPRGDMLRLGGGGGKVVFLRTEEVLEDGGA